MSVAPGPPPQPMLIKICGLRTIEHALAAAAAGANMIGLNFVPHSRRYVSVAEAAEIAAALRGRPGPRPQLVGLFVNEAPARIAHVATAVGLDLIQLSGDEPAAGAADLGLPLVRSLRMDGSAREAAWLDWAAEAGGPRLLVDAHVDGAYGGTGARADWVRAADLARRLPIMLAGGLDPLNVAAAIAAVRPWGVDVSSGVETDGLKDVAKIAAFVAAARAAVLP